jgi:hypothetical protein
MSVSGYKHVSRIFPFGNTSQNEPGGQLPGNVFDGVDREMRFAVDQGLFDLFDEQPLTSDFRQGPILNPVPRGDHMQFVN